MATHPSGYDTAAAMWAAVQARSRELLETTGTTPQNLQRQFVYDRFLARLFTSAPDGTWVLKGGTALLARVRSARHSRDIDLYHRDGTLDTAITELRSAAMIDLDDHFRFDFGLGVPTLTTQRPGQPGTELVTVKIDGDVAFPSRAWRGSSAASHVPHGALWDRWERRTGSSS